MFFRRTFHHYSAALYKCSVTFFVEISTSILSLSSEYLQLDQKKFKQHPLHSARSLLPTLQDYNQQ
jgi:hypothetical protein